MTGEGRNDSASRLIRATPDAIYRAFIDPAALVRWLPPAGMHGRVDAFDPRPGGAYGLTLTYDAPDPDHVGKTTGDSDTVRGHFVELVPGASIVQTADFESGDPRFAGTMTMTWTFGAVADGTLVMVVAGNVPPGISADDHQVGLESSLANLAAFAE